MNQLVRTENETVILNLNMTQEAFAKTRFAEKLKEKGVLAEFENGTWNLNPWTFDETMEKDGLIFLAGKAFDGTPAACIFETGTPEEIHKAAIAICGVLEAAVKSKAPLANIGAGGTMISKDCSKVLFLPYNFWTTAAMSSGDETYSNLNGKYICNSVNREISLRFTQAVLAYRTMAGKFPFTSTDSKQRGTDITDGNYSPLRWTVPGLGKTLYSFTEAALGLHPADYPAKAFADYKEPQLSQKEIEEFHGKALAHAAERAKHVKSRRFIRERKTVMIVAVAIAAVALLVAGHLHSTAMEKPTTTGLTSLETVQMYYTAVNELNVDAVQACTKNLSSKVDAVSGVFLTSRTRSMYNRLTDTITPAAFMIKNQTLHNIYGLSQFSVDGKEASLVLEGPRKNTRPEPLAEEDGTKLSEGDRRNFTATYYLWDTTGEDLLAVMAATDNMGLVYTKGRWLIDELESKVSAREFRLSEFIEDYGQCRLPENFTKEDTMNAIDSLKAKYDFLPVEHEIDEGFIYLKKLSAFRFE